MALNFVVGRTSYQYHLDFSFHIIWCVITTRIWIPNNLHYRIIRGTTLKYYCPFIHSVSNLFICVIIRIICNQFSFSLFFFASCFVPLNRIINNWKIFQYENNKQNIWLSVCNKVHLIELDLFLYPRTHNIILALRIIILLKVLIINKIKIYR